MSKKTKQAIRQNIIYQLQNLSAHDRHLYEKDFHQKAVALIEQERCKSIALYYAFHPELATQGLIHSLWQLEKNVYLPCILPGHHMIFVPYLPDSVLEQVRPGLWQPKLRDELNQQRFDMMIIPGLYYDLLGYRIGFGGGYYDRYLQVHPQSKTVSFAMPLQRLDGEGTWSQSFDIPVDKVITLSLKE